MRTTFPALCVIVLCTGFWAACDDTAGPQHKAEPDAISTFNALEAYSDGLMFSMPTGTNGVPNGPIKFYFSGGAFLLPSDLRNKKPAEVAAILADLASKVAAEPTPAPPIIVPPDFVLVENKDGARVDSQAIEQLAASDLRGDFSIAVVRKPGDKVERLTISIAVQGPRPPPAPPKPIDDVIPTPPDDASPKAEHLFFLAVDALASRSDLTAEQLTILDATSPLWVDVESRGHQFLSVDATSKTAGTYAKWIKSTPCIIVVDDQGDSGRVLDSVPLPKTVAEAKALETKYAKVKP